MAMIVRFFELVYYVQKWSYFVQNVSFYHFFDILIPEVQVLWKFFISLKSCHLFYNRACNSASF